MRDIKTMMLRVLPWTAAALALLLAVQIVRLFMQGPDAHGSASWAHLAKTLPEAQKLSKVIVVGTVRGVKPAADLIVKAAGEEGGVDRVPTEIVYIAVEKTFQGQAPSSLLLFHTALMKRGVEPQTLDNSKPPVSKTPAPRPDEGQQRTTILEDDPPYAQGERYLLFLADGPTVGESRTMAVIAPEGRYLVTPDGLLKPMTARGMAPSLAGKPLGAVVEGLRAIKVTTPLKITTPLKLDQVQPIAVPTK